ncbi:arylsulfatase A-like enzyme [Wenyingzhuangia heitensis]|uniref:Arylsulfatase A-like enzyme n=1 Tax=Wenyingzhuangia heitensis TaxID=1487859 RepID=A0ABX0UF32_9FLAO|nr:sulfatase [Wenyingzhuangia heitensis]NIJ46480.1 arylsulfatase A-like enzyme [Wenyingzhuangia heitensis]
MINIYFYRPIQFKVIMNPLRLILLVAITMLSACAQKQEKIEHPNIVWITSEDNSKHYLKLFDDNGIATPNIEALAEQGVIFDNAFSNAAVCSAARSTLISGIYGPRISSHYHRRLQQVPMPNNVEMYPAYLKQAGYYTTNCYKEDYNIIKSDTVWDSSSKKATWRNRKPGQPFFHVFNIMTTHESRVHFTQEDYETKKTNANPKDYSVQPNHPDTKLMKYTNAWYRDKIVQMDTEVGQVVDELKKDGLMDDTFIFYFSDHGGVLPGSKGYILETGLEVPMVVYIPEKYKHLVNIKAGTRNDGFVSFVDFGATLMNIAGIKIPEGIDGKPFLGKNISAKELSDRDETFSYSDRMDEKYDMVRGYRKGKYKYLRNFQPINYDGLMNNYRYKQLAYKEWSELNEAGKLNEVQSQFFNTKAPEALYDIEADPYETKNLANDPALKNKLVELRGLLTNKMETINDLSLYPEFYLIKNAFNNPAAFGKTHQADIKQYLSVANLALEDFKTAKNKIEKYLNSKDSWERYWAINACTSFGKQADQFVKNAIKISENDSELINRVKAAEFLGAIGNKNPVKVMTQALYDSKDPNEALLMLNSIVVMQDGFDYKFNLEKEKLATVYTEPQAVRRLDYLGVK